MNFKVVIPARLGSTRLPSKVLREIAGKPLVRHVWEAARASGAEQVVIATDEQSVAAAAQDFGAEVRLTAATHQSGTDRVNEVARAEARTAVKGRWVVLVDDVVTTGATLAACAETLEAAGAVAVSAITVARER